MRNAWNPDSSCLLLGARWTDSLSAVLGCNALSAQCLIPAVVFNSKVQCYKTRTNNVTAPAASHGRQNPLKENLPALGRQPTAVVPTMAMEDFLPVPFEEWVQEPEVIIGLVMAGVAPVAVPALICSEFWFNGGSSDGVHKDTAYYQEVVRTTALLWEGSCVFLLVYGCVQYTTTGAMIGVFFYSVVRSIAMTIVTYARVKKENNGHGVTDEPLEPVSVYTDIEAGTFLKCASVFVLQMLLYVLLLRWIASKSFSEEETTEQELVRYAAGSVVATVQRVMSQGFHSGELKPFWMTYFFSGHGQYRRHYHYPKMRLLMSWIVNDILFTTVFLLLPLVTMGSDNDMEFVKDCTAVLFISQFDSFEADIGEGHYLRAGREDKDEKRGKETVPAELATHTAEAVSDKGTEMEEQTGVNHAKVETKSSM